MLSPGWDALISHTPDARNVTVPVFILQTLPRPEAIEITGVRPDVAAAVGAYVLSLAVVEGTIVVKEIVWIPFATEMV